MFSNRELASFFWIGLLILFVLRDKEVRKSIWELIKALFDKRLIFLFSSLIAYVIGMLLVLHRFHFWDKTLLKDTVFWFTIPIGMLFKANTIKVDTYFKDIVLSNIKVTLIFEFVINFYNFNLITEFILMPIFLVVGLTQVVADINARKDVKYKDASVFLNYITNILVIIYVSFSFYKTLTSFHELVTIQNLKSFFLTIFLTLFIIPFIYFYSLITEYETLFIRINFMSKDENVKKNIRRSILKIAKINLKRLYIIDKRINKMNIDKVTNFDITLKRCFK